MSNVSFLNFPSWLMNNYMIEDERPGVIDSLTSFGIMAFAENYSEKNKDLDISEDRKIQLINEVFGLDIDSEYSHHLEIYQQILYNTPDKSPYSTMKLTNALNFRNEDKEFWHMQHALVIGMYSMLGKKRILKSNMTAILKRALGYNAGNSEASEANQSMIDKYSTRKRWERLIREVINHWGLHYHSERTRGFYYSFESKLTVRDFALAVKKRMNESSKAANKKKFISEIVNAL